MNNELKHYGIVGMKWGVRRYQNEDGSLTNAGKARYSDDKKTFKAELKADKAKAKEITRDAASAGKAYAIANKKYEKQKSIYDAANEASALSDSTRRKYELAKNVNDQLEADYKTQQRRAEDHRNSMIEKYGKDHVSDIKYREKNGVSIVDDSELHDVGKSIALAMAWVPLGAGYYSVMSSNSRGAQRYTQAYFDQKMRDLG